jgi:MinD-like ATPase involved in chromosome partitioning or flagellar assembly
VIVSLCSVRGSPGVTSWSLLLAAAWPSEYGTERVVLEADADGGVLGARYGFGVDPGVVSLIAAFRHVESKDVPVADHGRRVSDRVWVVPGPETGEQAHRVWHGSAEGVADRLARDDRVWLVDAGRANRSSPAAPLVERSALVVLLTRPATEDLVQIPARVSYLESHGASVGVFVVGRPQHSLDELAAFFGGSKVWQTNQDETVVTIAGDAMAGGRARRSWVWRSAVTIAADIAAIATAASAAGGIEDLDRRSVGGGE